MNLKTIPLLLTITSLLHPSHLNATQRDNSIDYGSMPAYQGIPNLNAQNLPRNLENPFNNLEKVLMDIQNNCMDRIKKLANDQGQTKQDVQNLKNKQYTEERLKKIKDIRSNNNNDPSDKKEYNDETLAKVLAQYNFEYENLRKKNEEITQKLQTLQSFKHQQETKNLKTIDTHATLSDQIKRFHENVNSITKDMKQDKKEMEKVFDLTLSKAKSNEEKIHDLEEQLKKNKNPLPHAQHTSNKTLSRHGNQLKTLEEEVALLKKQAENSYKPPAAKNNNHTKSKDPQYNALKDQLSKVTREVNQLTHALNEQKKTNKKTIASLGKKISRQSQLDTDESIQALEDQLEQQKKTTKSTIKDLKKQIQLVKSNETNDKQTLKKLEKEIKSLQNTVNEVKKYSQRTVDLNEDSRKFKMGLMAVYSMIGRICQQIGPVMSILNDKYDIVKAHKISELQEGQATLIPRNKGPLNFFDIPKDLTQTCNTLKKDNATLKKELHELMERMNRYEKYLGIPHNTPPIEKSKTSPCAITMPKKNLIKEKKPLCQRIPLDKIDKALNPTFIQLLPRPDRNAKHTFINSLKKIKNPPPKKISSSPQKNLPPSLRNIQKQSREEKMIDFSDVKNENLEKSFSFFLSCTKLFGKQYKLLVPEQQKLPIPIALSHEKRIKIDKPLFDTLKETPLGFLKYSVGYIAYSLDINFETLKERKLDKEVLKIYSDLTKIMVSNDEDSPQYHAPVKDLLQKYNTQVKALEKLQKKINNSENNSFVPCVICTGFLLRCAV